KLILQSLRRDGGWKEFYVEQMAKIDAPEAEPKALHVFAAESVAEKRYAEGAHDEAVAIIQALIDEYVSVPSDRGWYLQEMARYIYPKSKKVSNEYQVAAHRVNHYLLRPRMGMVLSKVATISQKRVQN